MNKLLYADYDLKPSKNYYLVFLKPSAFGTQRILGDHHFFKELVQEYEGKGDKWKTANIGFVSDYQIFSKWNSVRKFLRSDKIVNISLDEFKKEFGRKEIKARYGLDYRDVTKEVSMGFESIPESIELFKESGYETYSNYKEIPVYKYACSLYEKDDPTKNEINRAYSLNETMKDGSSFSSKVTGNEIENYYNPKVNNSFKAIDIKEREENYGSKELYLLVWEGYPIATYPAVNDLKHESIIQYFNYNKISSFNYKLVNEKVKIENFDSNEVKNIWKSIRFKLSESNKLDQIISGLKKEEFNISISENDILLTYNSSVERKTIEHSNEWALSNYFNLKNISEWLRSLGFETSHAEDSTSFYFTKEDKQLIISDHCKIKGKPVVFEFNGEKLTTIYTILQKDIESSGALISRICRYFNLR